MSILQLPAPAARFRRVLLPAIGRAEPLICLERGSIGGQEGARGWIWFGQVNMVYWGLLMLPMFVTLETALVCNMEHATGHWKHLNALPVPRGVLYAAKQCAGMGLIALSSLALVLSTVAAGAVLRLLRPGIDLDGAVPWGRLWAYAGLTYLGAWQIIAIQTWVGLRWKSFVVSCALGIAMTFAGVFIIHARWGAYWPWAMPGDIANEFSAAVVRLPQLLAGTIGGVILAVLGGWDVSRQDVL